ncbi:CATRA conflict system CASPASE/TPR repeat-associated protein, partial [Frankia sp. ACN1ag]
SAELVVHLVTPFDEGPLGERAYARMRGLWYACREVLGLSQPAHVVGVPADLPCSLPAARAGDLLAVQQAPDDGRGVFQTVLRRQHALLCLSAILAPAESPRRSGDGASGDGASADGASGDGEGGASTRASGGETVAVSRGGWSALDARWETASAPFRSEFVDETRIYQALLPEFDVFAHYPHAASPSLARACSAALPEFTRAAGWEARGGTTMSGFAVWEPGGGGDYRTLRRLVVLAAAAREAALGTWTWSSGDTAPPALALYLAQAAKMRLQGRVWSAGTTADRLRHRLDGTAKEIGGRLAQTGLLGAGPSSRLVNSVDADLAGRLAQLRTDSFHEQTVRMTIDDLRRNVEVAAANMRALTAREVIPTGYADPFGDDQRCAEHLLGVLADGAGYLRTAGRRAREVVRVCERLGVVSEPVDGAVFDLQLAGEDRLTLLDELADVYADLIRARQLLEELGVPRRRLPAETGLSARAWWGEVFHELESGLVATPYRDLLRAVLRHYRHNQVFRAIADRYSAGTWADPPGTPAE